MQGGLGHPETGHMIFVLLGTFNILMGLPQVFSGTQVIHRKKEVMEVFLLVLDVLGISSLLQGCGVEGKAIPKLAFTLSLCF